MSSSVNIRPAGEHDLSCLHGLFAEDGMTLPEREELLEGFVATNDADEPVGFIRILQVEDPQNSQGNGHYVYPIIVFKSWQGYGVGSALIQFAHQRFGALKLVACKASREFYPTCSFEPVGWQEIAPRIAKDCDLCPDLVDCSPQPFILE